MSGALKPGDRVRLTSANRLPGYRPGDRGTVVRTSPPASTSVPYFIVAMDKYRPRTGRVVFTGHEIEPDA